MKIKRHLITVKTNPHEPPRQFITLGTYEGGLRLIEAMLGPHFSHYHQYAGHWDRATNDIVSDLPVTLFEGRAAPGA